MKILPLAITFLVFSLGVLSAADLPINDLMRQLNGGDCKYEMNSRGLVRRSLFASFTRRHDAEYCVIDAARALGSLGIKATPAVPDLINALHKYHNIDTGDGILPVRISIVTALASVGDSRAIAPLQAILKSDDALVLGPSATGFSSASMRREKSSCGQIVQALRTLGEDIKEECN